MRTWLAVSAVFPCFIVVVACADEEPAPSTRPGGRGASAEPPATGSAIDMRWDGQSWVLARGDGAHPVTAAAC